MYVLLWSICRGGDDKKGGLLGKKKFVTPRQTVNKNNLLHYLTQLPGVFICGLLRWSTDLLRLASRYPWYSSLVRWQAGNHASLHTVLMNAHIHTHTHRNTIAYKKFELAGTFLKRHVCSLLTNRSQVYGGGGWEMHKSNFYKSYIKDSLKVRGCILLSRSAV